MAKEKSEYNIDEIASIPKKPLSKIRREINELVEKLEIRQDRRIVAINLDSREVHYFDSFQEVIEFINKRRGRWYIINPGIQMMGNGRE